MFSRWTSIWQLPWSPPFLSFAGVSGDGYSLCCCFNGGNFIYPRNRLCSHPCLYKTSVYLSSWSVHFDPAICVWAARPSSVLRHLLAGREAALPLMGTYYGKGHSNVSQPRRRRIKKESMEGSGLIQMVRLSSHRKVMGISNSILFLFYSFYSFMYGISNPISCL